MLPKPAARLTRRRALLAVKSAQLDASGSARSASRASRNDKPSCRTSCLTLAFFLLIHALKMGPFLRNAVFVEKQNLVVVYRLPQCILALM